MVITMEKQIVYAISNRKDRVCYEIGKNKSYYEFLLLLLQEFNVKQLPDFYGTDGKLPDATTKVDISFYWEDPNIDFTHFIGANKIFLMIRTEQRDKLRSFMEKNTEFVKTK